MKEKIVKYNNCDFRCYVKQLKSRKGNLYDRMYCGRVDPKCGQSETVAPASSTAILLNDIRNMIIKSGVAGVAESDLRNAFLSYDPPLVRQAIQTLMDTGAIVQTQNGKKVYLSADARVNPGATKVRQMFLAEAQEIVQNIEPFPPPLTLAQTFSDKHFRRDADKHVMEGHKYIGTPTTAILKTFRPELTERLLKIQEKRFFHAPGSEEHETFKDAYDKPATWSSTEVEWQLAGMVPMAKGDTNGLGHPLLDVAIFVSCKTGEVAQVNARFIHIVQDVCANARYFSHDANAIMASECQGERVMVTMPVEMQLQKQLQDAITHLLCLTL